MEERSKKMLTIGGVWLLIIICVWFAWTYLLRPHRENKLQEATGGASQYKHEVRFVTDSFSGYAIVRSPEFVEELKGKQIKLTHHLDTANYVERHKALRDGAYDFAVFTVDAEIKSGANPEVNGFPGTTVLVIDDSYGADAALVNRYAIKRMEDIKRILYIPDSPSEFLARVMVNSFSLPNLSGQWVGASEPKEIYKKLLLSEKNDPTAYILWEPYITKALANPDITDFFNSSKFKGYIFDVLLAERNFLRDKPEVVFDVVETYLRVAYRYTQDPDRLANLVAEDARIYGEPITEEEAKSIVKKIRWKNTLENYAHFGITPRENAKGLELMEDIYEKVARVLVDTGAVSSNPVEGKVTTLYHENILRKLYEGKFHPGRRINIVEDSHLPTLTEEVRGDHVLPTLNEKEWEALSPVGAMNVPPLAFQRGTTALSLESKRALDALVIQLTSWPDYYLTVMGRARALGDSQANMRLAERRATTTRDYLTARGVAEARIRAKAEKPKSTEVESQSTSFVLGQAPY